MGQPVVHFEIVGKDGAALQRYYADLFGWKLDTNHPGGYGMTNGDSAPVIGIGSTSRPYPSMNACWSGPAE